MDKEKRREYNRKWQAEHKEHLREYRKKHKESILKWHREYYKTHKEEIMESQKDYRKRNRVKVNKIMHDYRKRKATEFKAQGQMYYFLPKTERQNKMVAHLCNKIGLNKQESRKLLEENNWNIKALLPTKIKRSKRGRPRKDEIC